jgi:cyanophycinase
MSRFPLLFLSLLLTNVKALASLVDSDHFTTWTYPDNAVFKNTTTVPGAVLIGGGRDCVEAFAWQISNANGGDFVVLRASGSDAYNKEIYDISVVSGSPLSSVTTILFKDGEASTDPYILDIISNADAIFFAGGDQSKYLSYWVGTPVQEIIQDKLNSVTVSGTSAGLAILGNWIYRFEIF